MVIEEPDMASLHTGVETPSQLCAAALMALAARGFGVGDALRALRLVGHVDALSGRQQEVGPDLVPACAKEKICGLGAEPPLLAAVIVPLCPC
jgi:hypothetical protein